MVILGEGLRNQRSRCSELSLYGDRTVSPTVELRQVYFWTVLCNILTSRLSIPGKIWRHVAICLMSTFMST